MKIDYYNENYPDLEKFFKALKSNKDFDSFFDDKQVTIIYKPYNLEISITEDQIDNLENWKKPNKIKDLKYLDDYGIKFKNYYEICLNIKSPKYFNLLDENGTVWPTSPLIFKINDVKFEIGQISPLFVLLVEPVYSDFKYYDNFRAFASMKVKIENHSDFKNLFIKALYYLNSHYLKNIGFFANVNHLYMNFDYSYDENENDDFFHKATRKRIIKRKDLLNIEPLLFYNHAQILNSENKFRELYRILEFFFNKAKLYKLKNCRFDESISEDKIFKLIDIRNEEKQLANLLNESLSPSVKNKLTQYCKFNKLIKLNEFKYIHQQLYAFRNSIVHAKESEIDRTLLPDPFEYTSDIDKWIYVVDVIAQKCIQKYNTI